MRADFVHVALASVRFAERSIVAAGRYSANINVCYVKPPEQVWTCRRSEQLVDHERAARSPEWAPSRPHLNVVTRAEFFCCVRADCAGLYLAWESRVWVYPVNSNVTLVARYLRALLTVTNPQVGGQPSDVRGGRGNVSSQGVLLLPCPFHIPFISYCGLAQTCLYFASNIEEDFK